MVVTDRDNVREFLEEFKEIVVSGIGLDVIKRKDNMAALVELGITSNIRKEIILNLSVDNYSSGAEPDTDRPGEVWIFGGKINDKEIYIKLKVDKYGGEKFAKCISFHPARYTLNFPFRPKEGGVEE